MRRALLMGWTLLAWAPAVSAQLPDLPTIGRNWTDVSYPKLFWTPREGLTAGLYYAQIRPLGYEDFYAPPPYRASIAVDGQLSTSGSKAVTLEARLPRLVDGWRFVLTGTAARFAREPYFGTGNDAAYDAADVTDAQPHFYRSDTRRTFVRGEIQRRVIGGLRLLAGLHAERWRVDTLPGASRLAQDAAGTAGPTIGRRVRDVAGRIGLVFDTRNDEVAPRGGARVEAIYGAADSTVAGQLSYTRATVSAAGYLPVGEPLVIAARITVQTMSGAPGLGTIMWIEASDEPYQGLGGPYSHRALPEHRFLGADLLQANLDLRYDLMAEPTLYRVTAIGFLDAGRVFPAGDLALTTSDLHAGGGAGLIIQIFRAGILGTTAGMGPDGLAFQFHTRWTY